MPRAIEAMRPRIATLVAELPVGLAQKGSFDVISELAQPLPTIVIGDMLGMPARDWAKLKGWSDALAAFMGASQMTPAAGGGRAEERGRDGGLHARGDFRPPCTAAQ